MQSPNRNQFLISDQSSGSSSENGSAIVEFVVFGVAILMPVTLLLAGVFTLQKSAFTAQTAVREATRAFVLSESDVDAYRAAQLAADQVFADAAIPSSDLHFACSQSPCLSPSGEVRISVAFPVSLLIKSWTISAHHEEQVDPWM